jgi:hypothetical protein
VHQEKGPAATPGLRDQPVCPLLGTWPAHFLSQLVAGHNQSDDAVREILLMHDAASALLNDKHIQGPENTAQGASSRRHVVRVLGAPIVAACASTASAAICGLVSIEHLGAHRKGFALLF